MPSGVALAIAANGAVNGLKRAKHSHGYRPAAIVLDIEGTVAPISFVADVMFPYARDNVRTFLENNYDSAEARADVEAIRQQVRRVSGPRVFLCVLCGVPMGPALLTSCSRCPAVRTSLKHAHNTNRCQREVLAYKLRAILCCDCAGNSRRPGLPCHLCQQGRAG